MLISALATAAAVTAALLAANASTVCAPEPAHLNGPLYGSGSAASATLISSRTTMTGYQLSGSWVVSNLPAGAPCATYAAGPGTLLTQTIQASGPYRKCA